MQGLPCKIILKGEIFMVLKANGKLIDTLPIHSLFSQEEHYADTIVFEVARFHNGMDLAEFTFAIRGVTPSGGETQTALAMQVQEQTLRLLWEVSDQFTAEGGTLRLDLFAFRYDDPEADRTTTPPDHVLRYQLPDVEVHPLPESEGTLDSKSYTAFLLEVKETAEDAITVMNGIVSDFEAGAAAYDARLTTVEKQSAANDVQIETLQERHAALSERVTSNETGIALLREDIAAHTPVVPLTQAEYDAIASPAPLTVYVIYEES